MDAEHGGGAVGGSGCSPETSAQPRRQGCFNTWPAYLYEFAELVGQESQSMRLVPSPAAISQMEETLTWTFGLEPIDGRIVWMKAHGWRWKAICYRDGLQRSAANEHWLNMAIAETAHIGVGDDERQLAVEYRRFDGLVPCNAQWVILAFDPSLLWKYHAVCPGGSRLRIISRKLFGFDC